MYPKLSIAELLAWQQEHHLDLPATSRGIALKIQREDWEFEEVAGKGGKGGVKRIYALPDYLIDEIKEKLENLKTLVENAEEWDKKIKDAAGEYILEDAQSWWEPSSDYEDEDMPGLIEDLAEIVGKEEAEKMVNDEKLSLEAFKKLIYVNSITLNEDGNFNVSLFDIDELIFSGHIMFVYGNINGEFSGGDFAG